MAARGSRRWLLVTLVAACLLVGLLQLVSSLPALVIRPSMHHENRSRLLAGRHRLELTPAPKRIARPQGLSNSPVGGSVLTGSIRSSALPCDFTSNGGRWSVVGTVRGEEEGATTAAEHLIEWTPRNATAQQCRRSSTDGDVTTYHRFDQQLALKCLEGKHILMYGNSNTRTLYIALEALLRNKPMTSRVAAKQMCDNSRTNHSCWVRIEEPGYASIVMNYVSYTMDLYDEKWLGEKVRQLPMVQQHLVDLVVGNSGLNVIQLYDDAVFLANHRKNIGALRAFIDSFARGGGLANKSQQQPTFVWHKTTPVCANQPHFKRYRYNAKHWRYRTLDQINAAVVQSNRVVDEALSWADEAKVPVMVLDDWAMMTHRTDEKPFDLCPYFEDPLHHRFLDREVVQLLLNSYCP